MLERRTNAKEWTEGKSEEVLERSFLAEARPTNDSPSSSSVIVRAFSSFLAKSVAK
jgi:hypothetical protein